MARSRTEVNGEIEYHLQNIQAYQKIHYKFNMMSDEDYKRNKFLFKYGAFSAEGQFERFSNTHSSEMFVELKPTRSDLLKELTFTINHLLEGLGFSYRDYFRAQTET